jgi:hypothetical protein
MIYQIAFKEIASLLNIKDAILRFNAIDKTCLICYSSYNP